MQQSENFNDFISFLSASNYSIIAYKLCAIIYRGYSKIAQTASKALRYLEVPNFMRIHQFYLMIGIQPSAHRIVIRHDRARDRCTTIPVKVKDRRWFWIWHSDGIIFAFIQTLFCCAKLLIQFSAKFFEFLILSCQFVYFRYQLRRIIIRSFVCSWHRFTNKDSKIWVIANDSLVTYGLYDMEHIPIKGIFGYW